MSAMNLHGASLSAGDGWYTFTNLGPLTTTYTPAPSCTGTDGIAIGTVDTDSDYTVLWIDLQAQCTNEITYASDCMPTTTRAPESTSTGSADYEYDPYLDSYDAFGGAYYSPGVFCPSGWETIAMAGRDASSKLTTSGNLAPTTTTTSTSTKTRILITGTPTGLDLDDYDDYYDYYYDDYEDEEEYTVTQPVSLLATALGPRQTLALCCPSGYTTDAFGLCYSSVKDYTPTYGCSIRTHYSNEYTLVSSTYTQNIGESYAIVRTSTSLSPTATATEVTTYTTTIDATDRPYLNGYNYAPVVTIIHHESDVQAAHEAEESAAAVKNGTDDSPTNAAGRVALQASVWNGLGSVMGIWGAAVVVGAAMVLPW